jgi:hypothetical protein
MIMRKTFLIGCALLIPSAALSQERKGTVIARSVSRIVALENSCTQYFTVDHDVATRIVEAFHQIGVNLVGASAFDKAVQTELPRRVVEVQTMGSERWCREQKADLLNSVSTPAGTHDSGIKDLLPE